ncbi:MAG: outer membrane lipoprotein chaperone LolA [Magnetococcus sp. YQC-5]
MGWWLGMGSVTSAEAADKPPEVQRLQTFMDHLKSVTAEFDQQALDADADQPKESHGQFFAARPGRFRWDYTTPYKQMLISDGQTVWFYEPDLQQVTRSSAAKLNKSPAGFLTSGKRLEEIFTWEVVPGPDQDQPSVLLRPLQEGSLHWIAISLHPQREEITNFVVEDSLNHRSRIRFQNWRANTEIPAERFRFEVPNGVDVIDHKE